MAFFLKLLKKLLPEKAAYLLEAWEHLRFINATVKDWRVGSMDTEKLENLVEGSAHQYPGYEWRPNLEAFNIITAPEIGAIMEFGLIIACDIAKKGKACSRDDQYGEIEYFTKILLSSPHAEYAAYLAPGASLLNERSEQMFNAVFRKINMERKAGAKIPILTPSLFD
ncbi:MAG TPA: hypothetical protein VEB60_00100 [Candidatus Paceibacterota bacterium]|nr:hypothetical protein [Candidatus Paceibacterota bacterium]